MHVAWRRVAQRRAVERARDDHRGLGGEIDEALDDHLAPAEPGPCRREIARCIEPCLTLAVVAFSGGLGDCWRAHLAHGGNEAGLVVRHGKGRCRHADALEEALLALAVLRHAQRLDAGAQRPQRRQERGAGHRHVLEFVGDDIDAGRESRAARAIVPFGAGQAAETSAAGDSASGA